MSDDCCNEFLDQAKSYEQPKHTAEMNAIDWDTRSCSTENMIQLEGGVFQMGSVGAEVRPEDGEGPVRNVEVNPFYMDQTTVTNQQFQKFVNETGYVTEAERFGWSFVFHIFLSKSKLRKLREQSVSNLEWWYAIEGACWNKPYGSGSNIKKIMDHPVTQVSWNDAHAFCKWAGKRLPYEAEWEYASRGGQTGLIFPWGNELDPGGKFRCNTWQGNFPLTNSKDDGYIGTAPAKSYRANDFGLYNTIGNVWEWCQDYWTTIHDSGNPISNPTGPETGDKKLCKGGSFLCHISYCNRYRNSARTANTPDSASCNFGFRCVRDI